jgi:Protein of unknown function (DUF3592)
MSKMGVLSLADIFLVVGVGFLARAGWTAKRRYTIIKAWPTVEAEVTKSHIHEWQSAETDAQPARPVYQVQAEFHYAVNRKQFDTLKKCPVWAISGYRSRRT